jgi:hypothetical protein
MITLFTTLFDQWKRGYGPSGLGSFRAFFKSLSADCLKLMSLSVPEGTTQARESMIFVWNSVTHLTKVHSESKL